MRSKNTFSISFFVKKHRFSNGKVPVYVRLTINGKRLGISAKRKILLDNWDEIRGTARGSKNEAKVLNSYLEQVRHKLYECAQELGKKENC